MAIDTRAIEQSKIEIVFSLRPFATTKSVASGQAPVASNQAMNQSINSLSFSHGELRHAHTHTHFECVIADVVHWLWPHAATSFKITIQHSRLIFASPISFA